MAFSSVQSLSRVWLWDPMDCSTPGFTVLHHLPELVQTHVHWVSGAIQPSHALSPPSPLALSLSQHQGLFQWASCSHQVAKVLELQLQQHSYSNEYAGLISFRIEWLDLLAVQGTLRNLLQHHNLKVPILQCSAFFMVQLTSVHDYWKNHSFDYMNFVVKVMSLLFSEEKSLIIFIKCLQLNF